MARSNGRRHVVINLHPDPVEVMMRRVERLTEIAVRITRNTVKILTMVLGAASAGLWTLYTIVELFR